jgi:hypothetical protein
VIARAVRATTPRAAAKPRPRPRRSDDNGIW